MHGNVICEVAVSRTIKCFDDFFEIESKTIEWMLGMHAIIQWLNKRKLLNFFKSKNCFRIVH